MMCKCHSSHVRTRLVHAAPTGRAGDSSSCLDESSHVWVLVNTHGVAHRHHDRHDKCHKHYVLSQHLFLFLLFLFFLSSFLSFCFP